MRPSARAERQDQIETAAYRLLDEKGFEGLSVLAVARAAKASNETLYRWYGDKTGLMAALIARNTAQVTALLEDAPTDPPLDQLARIGPALLTMLTSPRAIALNRAASADSTGTLGGALRDGGRDALRPRIVAIMRAALDQGALSGAAPEILAELWLSLLIGDLQLRCVTRAIDPPNHPAIQDRARTALALLCRLHPPQG